MLAQVTHILGLTYLRRVRLLPVPGRVLVQPGQHVNASDVVAEAEMATRHMLLDIRRSLGFQRVDETERAIVRHEGDKVAEGDVLAESGGLFARIVRAPANGKVVMVSGGRVLMEVDNKPVQVMAGIPGTVAEIYPERGAAVENNGALIQGAWGNNRVGDGLMVAMINSPEAELSRGMMEVSLRGAVLVSGHVEDPEVLRIANTLPLRGLLISSMSSDLATLAAGLDFPVIVLEGFGRIPMDDTAFKLLTTSDKRDVSINSTFNLAAGDRPELFIPLPSTGQTSPETAYFAVNQTVRIQGAPYQGKIGVIVQIHPGLTILPNGVRAPAADVRLEKDTQVIIPLANLEVIE
jgi:hypothetical protein